MQKLFALNSRFMIERAKSLAARVTADKKESERARVEKTYALLFAREPEREEMKLALEFLRKPESNGLTRWEQYAQVLLSASEFLYVD